MEVLNSAKSPFFLTPIDVSPEKSAALSLFASGHTYRDISRLMNTHPLQVKQWLGVEDVESRKA